MENLLPGIIVSFREALEAFLILIFLFQFLQKTKNSHLIKSAVYGFISSVIFCLIIGFILFMLGVELEKMENVGALWVSIASLIVVGLVTTFIIWMIKHGNEIKEYVERTTAVSLTKTGIFIVSFGLVAREGIEIAFFSFAGQYHYLSIIIGISGALLLSAGLYFSLLKINISSVFRITLLYLIIQVGYMLGNVFHEGLSAMNALGYLTDGSPLLTKVFDLSGTILNHENGVLGLPLNIILGWVSDPQWLQFIAQYAFTAYLFILWLKENVRNR